MADLLTTPASAASSCQATPIPEPLPIDPGSQAAARILEANRASFDSPTPSPGATADRVATLSAELAAARAEAELLQAQIQAIETSTSWRLTAPLRSVVTRIRPPPAATTPGRDTAGREPLTYAAWIATCEPVCLADLAAAHKGSHPVMPQRLGVVLLPGPEAAAALADMPRDIAILALGLEPDCVQPAPGRLTVQPVRAGLHPAEAVQIATDCLDADLICFLDPRDTPAKAAWTLVGGFAARHPEADILFADEDWLVGTDRVEPFLKPGWDRELQRGRDLLGPFTFFRTALLREAVAQPGAAWLYDLANQAAAATAPERIRHIPAVLCHRGAPAPPPDAIARASEAALWREGIAGWADPTPVHGHRVHYRLPHPAPLVSVIVPTRDRAELLATCTDALLRRTAYDRLELIIVDNGSVQPEALALLERLAGDARVRVIPAPGPFNWSVLNNRAAREASGDVLLLMNNDIDALHPDWLSVLVSHAIQPGVGAVGPTLLYPDGRVQHAGLTTDMTGVPRHLFRFADGAGAGPFAMLHLAREVWGVTGACLAIARATFLAVGGLNEALPVAYNDVDLCLRLTAFGYRIVWTPWARLEHRELASRAPDHSPERRDQAREELDRLQRDWGRLAVVDPFLNRNLHLVDEQPRFGPAPPP